MRDLHPVRAQNINLRRITKSVIFQRSFSIFGFCVNGYNSLVLRDNLNHRCWITVELSMNGVSIIWIIENSHVTWYILLVSIVFTSWFSVNFILSWNEFFRSSNVILNVSKNLGVIVIILFVFRDLKLLF